MPATERMPASLGPYRLQDRLGEGGMGVVHLARDPEGRLVALKVLRPWVAGDVNARRRLIREVETMRRVHSPYVAEVLDADVLGEFPYIVTRYVPGPTLDELVRRQGPLSASGVQRLATGLAEALAAIHAAGIVHRDLKPGNVMLTDDRPVVIDFGIAQAPEATRLTQTGMVMGTPGYLAPEVIEGKPSSPASDVHSWGATIAFAATGRPPYGTGSFETIFFRVISGRADLAGVPAALVPLVSAALARDPARRPAATWLSTSCRDGYSATGLNGNGSPKALSETNLDTLTALDPLERRQLYPARPGNNGSRNGAAQEHARARAIPSAPLLPPGPIGRAGIPGDPPAGRPARAPRPAGQEARPGWLPGLAFTVAAAALTVALPVAGLIASLAVITLLRAADTAQHHLVARGPLAILLAPLTLARALLTTIMLAPFAIVSGLAGWAATIALTHHVGTPKAPAFGAAAAVICYAIGPGSRRPRRQLRQIAGALSRTPMSATAAALASWALAAAAVTIAMSQPPYFWPATAPSVPHVAVIPHLPMLPQIPSLHSLVTSTATWLTGHTRL
ncbi:MAG TPA: serine/threonine-protein kinase [Streptosporangiaceae bacterium]